jgi:hypothetical protein
LLSGLLPRRLRRRRASISAGQSRIRASIDEATSAFVRGWAYDPASKEPAIIEVRSSAGEVLSTATAHRPRPDVGRELGTDGMHGFFVPLPAPRGAKGSVHVFARFSSGEAQLVVLDLEESGDFPSLATIDFRETMIVVRPDRLHEILGNETLLICGASRGTSLIANILQRLGYYLGDNVNVDCDDQDVVAAISSPSEMQAIIVERNHQNKRWGLKIPTAVRDLDWLAATVRNPLFLVAFVNPVAIAESSLNNNLVPDDFGLALDNAFAEMEFSTQTLISEAPSVLIDVDAARKTTELLVRDLAALLVANASKQLIELVVTDLRRASTGT